MRRRSLVVGAAVLFGLVAPACGEEAISTSGADWAAPSFSAGWVPDGFDLVRRVEPTGEPVLSDDSSWGLEPFLLVAPDDWDGDPSAAALVSLVDGTYNEGGLGQGVPTYPDSSSPTTLDGREAWRIPDGIVDGPYTALPQVIVRVGGERGVRVRSADAPIGVLDALATAAGLHGDVPTLSSVPRGWRIAGQVTGPQLGNLGVEPWYSDASDTWPGVLGGKVSVWTSGSVVLEVAVLPGDDGSLDAAGQFHLVDGGWSRRPWRVERDGARWWSTLEYTEPGGTLDRHLERVGRGPGGHVLFVGAATNTSEPLPDRADLDRIARSVVVDDTGWTDARAAQRAEPPRSRPGREELARGDVDGTEWIVETDPVLIAELTTSNPSVGANPYGIATELVLTGGGVLGATTTYGGGGTVVAELTSMNTGEPPAFTATLVIVGPEVAEVAFPPDATRRPTVPAGTGRVAVISPPVAGSAGTLVRYDAAGNALP